MKPRVIKIANVPAALTTQLGERFTVEDVGPNPEPARLQAVAPGARALVANGESVVSEGLIAALPDLELIAVCGVGYDGVNVAAASARGIHVTNTPNVLTDDVADLAIGLLIATARQLPRADRYVRDGRWPSGAYPLTRKVSGSRLGVVGLGRIGSAVAHRAASFGMEIAYHNRRRRPDVPYRYAATLVELASSVDFLIVCAQGGAQTRHLINAEVIEALGPTGILINVGRGSIVDEAAVATALRDGKLAGAGLDVFEREPHVLAALLECPTAVLTPHVGSATASTRKAMGDLVLANLEAHFAGKPLVTPIPSA
jgi:lactate dehydrogenase-like 2-hydroxyacid dehydrogenase